MNPLYTAKKSILPAFTFWRVVLFWLIVPTIMIIADIIKLKNQSVEFYDSYVITKSGVFVKDEKKSIFPNLVTVSTKISVFGYGDVIIDTVGKCDLNLTGVTQPKKLREFLENHMVSGDVVAQMSNNPYTTAMN